MFAMRAGMDSSERRTNRPLEARCQQRWAAVAWRQVCPFAVAGPLASYLKEDEECSLAR